MYSAIFSRHTFADLETVPFNIQAYSALKFGSNAIAMAFGIELADGFFAKHSAYLLANRCVVIPSPYNHVENAASIMTRHFIDRLNALLVNANGEHVERTIIHRKVSYTNDYGFLSAEKRKELIGNDRFYFNRQFIEKKTLVFIDDVRITGTHEEKLVELMVREGISNPVFFLYYADYTGNTPDIEARLNFAAIRNANDYVQLVLSSECNVIVRTIKYLLGLGPDELGAVIAKLPHSFLEKVYYGALGEGYYKVPAYQLNFGKLQKKIEGKL